MRHRQRYELANGRLKALLDYVGAGLLTTLLAPVIAGTAVAVKLSTPGPAFFRQTRVGRDGEAFRVWKLRTMYVDAEARLESLQGLNETDGLLFKIKDDPRITPVGAWLRRTSLDELPQLFNVLQGDMSLVGPRPLPVSNEDFVGEARRRLLVKPGITGLWQISGRSELSWEEALSLDLSYVDNWSLAGDLRILLGTLPAVLRKEGAY